ncbi:MAG: hypothetical protein A2261_03850 [Candidatus Magasanikbacteria bacterium RIFOXYA2_FULL_44_8]|uniref:Uncharacterized protein n=1 Tax=Candidatus Magasanikbacteria bacterium RIFOXYA2_FULL_44_8 TaxID=1798696 RepID=A0A1F6NJ71_9BACT|nr:MAG: hypothetical protein A2261_03850 [Candidatus Magasanikbacteria bacterium RIFOXYA2_FULL_44_8]
MTLRQYLILMSLGTLICWAAWVVIINTFDPNTAGILGLLFFYVSLFLALVGTFSVIVFLIRRVIIKNDEVIFRHVRRTLRQSIVVSTLIIFVLFLLQKQLLTWWNLALVLILFFAIEGIVFTSRKYNNQDYVR